MNEIERILHKYFSDEEMEYRSLSGRLDDPAWMERHGYTKQKKTGVGISNELTPEGKKFVQESEKRISKLIKVIMNKRASADDETRAVREIKSYLWSKPDMDVEKELSDELYYVYLSLSPDW